MIYYVFLCGEVTGISCYN